MSPEKPAQAASHAVQDAAGRDAIDRELELGASAADAANKNKETKPTEKKKPKIYIRRSI